MSGGIIIEAVGASVEEALEKAHQQIPPRPNSDFAISRVLEWGGQFGGFAQVMSYWVRVEVDEYSPMKT